MMNKKSCSSPLNAWQFLVLVLGAILVVAISVDIYIRLLLPEAEVISNTIPKLNPNSPSRTQQNTQPESQYDEAVSIGSIFRNLKDLEDMSLSGDKTWESMFPKGGGYLYVRSNDSSTRSEAWGVSMFHSLHCLLMLRSGIQKDQLPISDHENMARRFNLHISPNHMAHCISYLAQTIMCTADGTIEPPSIINDESINITRSIVDGMGVRHQCKDNNLLWQKTVESESQPVDRWGYKNGDNVYSVWES